MKVNIRKAQKVGDRPSGNLTIRVVDPMPADLPTLRDQESYSEWRSRNLQRFHAEAKKLADALLEYLPGGTIDQLVVLLLEHQASLYVNPHKERR